MAIDDQTKLRHLESRLQDEELAAFYEAVKLMTPEQLQEELKKLKRNVITGKITELEAELQLYSD